MDIVTIEMEYLKKYMKTILESISDDGVYNPKYLNNLLLLHSQVGIHRAIWAPRIRGSRYR